MFPVSCIYIVLHECVVAFSILYIFRLCDYGCRDGEFLSMPAVHVSRISPCMLFNHWSAYTDWSSIPVQSVSSKKKSPQLPFRDDHTIIIVHSSIFNTLFRKIVVNKIVKLVVIVCDMWIINMLSPWRPFYWRYVSKCLGTWRLCYWNIFLGSMSVLVPLTLVVLWVYASPQYGDVLDYVVWGHDNTTCCTGSDTPPFVKCGQ